MSKSAIEGRQRVIEAAAAMLASHGLRGISIREVIKFANAPLGSTYHNFPNGKQQIVTEAVQWAGEQASAQLQACLAQDKENGIQLFLQQWRKRLTKSEFRHGCPIVAAAIEASEEEDAEPVKQAVSTVFAHWQQLLTTHLISLGHAASYAQSLAVAVIACIEGAVVLCRGQQNIAPFDAIIECIPAMLAAKQA